MHLIFERSRGVFESNCNILALAWMPYYDEVKFRQALFDYHQRQLVNLTSSIAANYHQPAEIQDQNNANNRIGHLARSHNARLQSMNNQLPDQQQQHQLNTEFLDSRLTELYNRYQKLKEQNNNKQQLNYNNIENINKELSTKYGLNKNFGWLAIGNVGKFVGITLTTLLSPLIENNSNNRKNKQNGCEEEDLMQFDNFSINDDNNNNNQKPILDENNNSSSIIEIDDNNNLDRPDKSLHRNNYNLRGHLNEIILVKWNDLYQKLATIDSKGNVLIWCKLNDKFTIQTPFYNRTKTVADFKWSNDGKTALICYTDAFILVGSSSGQRHWHSMLNLDDYHITCASWTPNDEQLLLGVSNGNIVVIDLPHSELTELVINQCNIRAMCWSSSDIYNLIELNQKISQQQQTNFNNIKTRENLNYRRGSTNIVNQRRLSRDCSVFSRFRLCSQGPNSNSNININDNDNNNSNSNDFTVTQNGKLFDYLERNILAIDFANDSIKLYDGGLDDPEPKVIQVNLQSYIMHWSNNGKILAVAGFRIHTSAPSIGCLKCRYLNTIKFYDKKGQLIYEHTLNYTRYPITAFTWAHNDKRLFLATGPKLHCAKVFFGIPSLNLLTSSCLYNNTKLLNKFNLLENIVKNNQPNDRVLNWQAYNCPIDINKESNLKKKFDRNNNNNNNGSGSNSDDSNKNGLSSSSSLEKLNLRKNWINSNVQKYNLPEKLKINIDNLFNQTIRQPFDECWSLNDIIWHVPKNNKRYFCTLICYTSDKDLNSQNYQYRTETISNRLSDNQATSDQNKIFVLYIEFEGSLIPILRARRVGFLKPEFVIFDPQDNKSKLSRQQQQQYRKVSDISQQASPTFIKSYLKLQQEEQLASLFNKPSLVSSLHTQIYNNNNNNNNNNNYINDDNNGANFGENCSDLHVYSEPSSSIGRQSISDAEYYYNFDNPSSLSAAATKTTNNDRQLNDINNSQLFASNNNNNTDHFVNGRSHHQEPLVLPISSNPYLFYMLAMSSGNSKQILNYNQAKNQLSNNCSQLHNNDNNRKLNNKQKNDNKQQNYNKSVGLSSILNENNELVRVKSNIWGTKFKLINVGNFMIKQRSILASVAYKASILHLQPRQIFLNIKDMSNYCCLCSKHHHTKLVVNKRQLNNPSGNKTISLLDMPNQMEISNNSSKNNYNNKDKSLTTSRRSSIRNNNGGGSGSTKSSSSSSSCRKKSNSIDNKVIVSVGDSIKIVPKLEKNQKYKFANKNENFNSKNFLHDNQKPTTSRQYNSYNNNIISLNNSSVKQRESFNNNKSKPIIKSKSLASSSETHKSNYQIKNNNNNSSQYKSNQSFKESQDIYDDYDLNDILTLSLDQSEKIKVEMSSSTNHLKNDNLNDDQKLHKQLTDSTVDEFISSNKTLKSIQTITKMILDLSSKANDVDGDSNVANDAYDKNMDANNSVANKNDKNELDESQFSSPSKLIRLETQFDKNIGKSSISTKYVAPNAPVHKPKHNLASRLIITDNDANVDNRFLTQSATTTPLKGFKNSKQRNENKNKRRKSRRTTTTTRRRKSDNNIEHLSFDHNPLPPPPPSMPISRKLSSTAKRFFDGSVRSLYGGYSSTATLMTSSSDYEQEDNEPLLVTNNIRRKLLLSSNKLTTNVNYSQPNTPLKTSKNFDLLPETSFKEKLFDSIRMRGQNNKNKSNSYSASSSQLDKYTDQFVKKFYPQNKFKQKESTSPHQLYNDNDSVSNIDSSLDEFSSLSDLSLFDSDSNDGEDDEMFSKRGRFSNAKKQLEKCKFVSNSVKNLQEIGKNSKSRKFLDKKHHHGYDNQTSGANLNMKSTNLSKQERDFIKRKRHNNRRKSICSNNKCCCAKEFKLNNRPPVWNDLSQVYQLDFGGRVTQESAKNLQIDFEGNLALQFGRIDRCTYTLDYKYPFNAVQAMAIALASLTQRLK